MDPDVDGQDHSGFTEMNCASTDELFINILKNQCLLSGPYKTDLGYFLLEYILDELNIPFLKSHVTNALEGIEPIVEVISEQLILKIQCNLRSVVRHAIHILKKRLLDDKLGDCTFQAISKLYNTKSLPLGCNEADFFDLISHLGLHPQNFVIDPPEYDKLENSVNLDSKSKIPQDLPVSSFNHNHQSIGEDTYIDLISPSKTLPVELIPHHESATLGIDDNDGSKQDKECSTLDTGVGNRDTSIQEILPPPNSPDPMAVKPPINVDPSLVSSDKLASQHCLGDIILFEPHSPILLIQGYNQPLSNFHLDNFSLDGITFKSVHHSLEYHKAMHFGDTKLANNILSCATAAPIKEFTKPLDDIIATKRHLDGNSKALEWLCVRNQILTNILEAKFSQSHIFRKTLRESHTSKILLGVKDEYYGTGIITKSFPQGTGLNMYGMSLMELRQRHSNVRMEHPNMQALDDTIGSLNHNQMQPKITSIFQTKMKQTIPAATGTNSMEPLISDLADDNPPMVMDISSPIKRPSPPSHSNSIPQKKSKPVLKQPTLKPSPNLPPLWHIKFKPWKLPPIQNNKPLLISDDQGAISDKSAPREFQVISVSKAKLDNITTLFKDSKVCRDIKTVFIQIGANNKDQNFVKTSRKCLSKMTSQLTKCFPEAELVFVPIFFDKAGSALSKEQKTNLNDLNSGFGNKFRMLPLPLEFKPKINISGFSVTPGTQNQLVSFMNDFLFN